MSVAQAALGLTGTEVDRVLTTSALAPSVHNTQPWRFRVTPAAIELHGDPDWLLPGTDPDGRELRLSCGAALFNLRLALRHAGVRPLVTVLPNAAGRGRGSDALAVVRHGGQTALSAEANRFLAAVTARRTNLAPFTDRPVSAADRLVLARAVEAERAWLHQLTGDADRAELRDLVIQAHHEQHADPAYQTELRRWVERAGFAPGVNGDGLPQSPDALFRKDFHDRMDRGQAGGPLLVLVCSFHNGPGAEVQSGQALQRLLLTATTLGMSASFLSGPIEVPHLRARLRRTLGGGLQPHAILCLGYAHPMPRTSRRPIRELLLTEPVRS